MDNQSVPIVLFDDSSKEKIVKALGLKINPDGRLADEDGKILTNQVYEDIRFDDFGGILISSKLPIKKDQSEIVKYFLRKKD